MAKNAKKTGTKLEKLQAEEEQLRANLEAVRKQKLAEEKKSNGGGFISRVKTFAKNAVSHVRNGLSWLWNTALKVLGFGWRIIRAGVGIALVGLHLVGVLAGSILGFAYDKVKQGAVFLKDKALEFWAYIRPTVLNIGQKIKATALAFWDSAKKVGNFCYEKALASINAALKLVDLAVGLVVTVTVMVLDVAARVTGQFIARGIIAYQEVLKQTGMESGKVPQAKAAAA